jgi:ribonuclease HI
LAWTLVDPRPDAIEFPDSVETAPPWELSQVRPGSRVLVIADTDTGRAREWLTVLGRSGDLLSCRQGSEVVDVPLGHVVSAEPEPHLGEVVDGELELLTAAGRADVDRVGDLLDPAYTEFGRSGRTYDRAAVLGHIAEDIECRDVLAEEVAPGVALVTYRSLRDGGAAHRTSVWVRGGDGRWRLRHHQGTDVANA